MKKVWTFFLIAITLNYWLPVAEAQDLAKFPAAGPKIEGPWLWMIAPTSEPGGAQAAASGIDWLASASGGSVTEQQIATNGVTARSAVGGRDWTLGTLAPTGGNNITDMVNAIGLANGDIDHHVAYGFIILDSPQQQNTTMYVGSDDAVRVWLNGVVIHNNPIDRGADDYQESFPVTLKKGKNILLVTVYEERGGWSGFFGFTDDAAYSLKVPLPVHIGAAQRPPMYWVDAGVIYALVGEDVQKFAPDVNNALSIAVDANGNKIYWTEETGESVGTINSANLDGSGVTRVISIPAVPIGIAVDTAESKLYWTNSRGRIQRANLDGSNVQNVVTDLLAPVDIAVADGNVYWSQLDGRVQFMNLKGQKVIRDISTEPGFATLAIGGGKVYWTEETGESVGTINSANLDGTGSTELASILAVPLSVAVDTVGSKLYWMNSRGRIQRANLDGSNIQNVVDGLGQPTKIVISNSIATPASPPATTPKPTTPVSKYDVNGDGTVDIMDVEVVFTALCSGNPPATPGELDVTDDGQLTIQDLVAVSQNIETSEAAAAPAFRMKLTGTQIARIQEQIDLLQAMNDRSLGVQRTLAYLHRLLTEARPEKTQLLANYPNPFNPETWIPYELATDTNVQITIYNTHGVVVRTLQLGHQAAGYYTSRDRAAYWDGRNVLGEPVASGIYFYQLRADNVSALRKMLILK